MDRVTDKFKFKLPNGWEDQSVYYFKGPDEGGRDHLITLTVDRRPQQDSIKSFVRQRTDPITATLDGIEILKDEDITIEGGHPAWEWVFRWIPAEGLVEFHKYVFVLCDGMGFTFNGRFSKHTLKSVGLQFKDVVEAAVPGTYEPIEED